MMFNQMAWTIRNFIAANTLKTHYFLQTLHIRILEIGRIFFRQPTKK